MQQGRPLFGLVIQGPVLSNGKHGGTLGTDSDEQLNFNSSENIRKYTAICKELGAPLVLATWHNQPMKAIECPVLLLPNENLLPNGYPTRESSKYFQAVTTLAGIKYLKSFQPNFVIKVRADQEVDIVAIASAVSKFGSNSGQKYFVPFMDPQKFWSLQDFYFAANIELAELVWSHYLALPEFHSHVHQDYFWKVGYILEKKLDSNQTGISEYFPRFGRPWTRKQRRRSLEIYNKFVPLPKRVWINLVWRGRRVGIQGVEDVMNKTFLDNFDNKVRPVTDKYETNAMRRLSQLLQLSVTTDWARYFYFVFFSNKFSTFLRPVLKVNYVFEGLAFRVQKMLSKFNRHMPYKVNKIYKSKKNRRY